MEFTNGNYYLVDIREIALLTEESGNVYHSYEKIGNSVPKQVQLLTGITNRNVMDGLVEFIRCERTHTHTHTHRQSLLHMEAMHMTFRSY